MAEPKANQSQEHRKQRPDVDETAEVDRNLSRQNVRDNAEPPSKRGQDRHDGGDISSAPESGTERDDTQLPQNPDRVGRFEGEEG